MDTTCYHLDDSSKCHAKHQTDDTLYRIDGRVKYRQGRLLSIGYRPGTPPTNKSPGAGIEKLIYGSKSPEAGIEKLSYRISIREREANLQNKILGSGTGRDQIRIPTIKIKSRKYRFEYKNFSISNIG